MTPTAESAPDQQVRGTSPSAQPYFVMIRPAFVEAEETTELPG